MSQPELLIILGSAVFSALSAVVGSLALHILTRMEQTVDDHEVRIRTLEVKV